MVDRQLTGIPVQVLRSWIRARRERNPAVVRGLDLLRALLRPDSRAVLLTRLRHQDDLHQTSSTTWDERYPELFDLAAELCPVARRVLSFGCSTGEELGAIRRRFPKAEIVGAEINPRSRKLAARRVAADSRCSVVPPSEVDGSFDIIFALAVLQRLPERVAKLGIDDLSGSYPFDRFDRQVTVLAEFLTPGGMLCVMNAHYRVEDSRVAPVLEPLEGSLQLEHPIFDRDGKKLSAETIGRSLFRKT